MADISHTVGKNAACLYPLSADQIPIPIMGNTELELVRLREERELLLLYEGDVLPEQEHLVGISTILNVACGSGTWALEVARLNSNIQIIGIDMNARMIDYARRRAKYQKINTVQFLTKDFTKPLQSPDGSFDLVNAQFCQGSLTTTTWLPFLKECARVTRPGGIIRLTESSGTESNSLYVVRLADLLTQALYRDGRSFSTDGNVQGISFMLAPMLQEAGYSITQQKDIAVDYSSDMQINHRALHHFQVSFSPTLLGSFIIQMGVTSYEEYQQSYEQAMKAMASLGFRATWHLLTITGKKPE